MAAQSSSGSGGASAGGTVMGDGVGDALPLLTRIDAQDADVLAKIQAPVKRLYTDADLAAFQRSDAHRTFSLFVSRLAEASVSVPILSDVPASASETLREGARRVLALLGQLDLWTTEIEPEQGPQRFGNIAFRSWGKRLEERTNQLHDDLLPPHLRPFVAELQSPFLSSFGNFTRIDYGSGHELSFATWICLLFRLNFFGTFDGAGVENPQTVALQHRETERVIALLLLPAYLKTVYALQNRYSLEPAGSHGVWGLDDFHFLPYIIGSAQLSAQTAFKPRDILPPTSKPAPFDNLYSASIARILTLKHGGPFTEHSPMLTDIATSVPTWQKVLRGLLRMYEAEVLGKRVVVQLWEFGGVGWVWEGEHRPAPPPGDADEGPARGARTGDGDTTTTASLPMAPTAAPWAAGSAAGGGAAQAGFAPTGAPWATGAPSGGAFPSALGARPGGPSSRPMMSFQPTPAPFRSGATPAQDARTSLYSTGSAAAASSPFGSLARSTAVPGRMGGIGFGAHSAARGPALRDPLAEPDDPASSVAARSPAPNQR